MYLMVHVSWSSKHKAKSTNNEWSTIWWNGIWRTQRIEENVR